MALIRNSLNMIAETKLPEDFEGGCKVTACRLLLTGRCNRQVAESFCRLRCCDNRLPSSADRTAISFFRRPVRTVCDTVYRDPVVDFNHPPYREPE